MRKISYVLAALAGIALTVPAVAQDKPMKQAKPMMKEGMDKPMVRHHRHHHRHHEMKKPMTDKM
jgi:ABC-type nickel/cobalt efflux system permease component RcnA